ncbi:MAG: hypothetical protein DMG58_23210 [Acidobacteria bacterium]|nr:MAG: hypothetical protein DMG58_23210 [Acidobacteriota bacterium]
MAKAPASNIEKLYRQRTSSRWRARVARWLRPPDPLILNPRELEVDAPLGRWNLYLGGAGTSVSGYVNVDLFALPGVDVAANAEQLPFRGGVFQRIECDAVLEHVERPERVMAEIERVLIPGGMAHLVVPFCHPFHELAYRPYGHAAGVCSRVREGLATVAPGTCGRARRAGLAAVSAPLSRSHCAAVAASGTDRQPLLRMAA